MFKILTTIFIAVSILVSTLSGNPTVEAAKIPNQKEESSQAKYKDVQGLLAENSSSKNTKKSKPKIVNGELDLQV